MRKDDACHEKERLEDRYRADQVAWCRERTTDELVAWRAELRQRMGRVTVTVSPTSEQMLLLHADELAELVLREKGWLPTGARPAAREALALVTRRRGSVQAVCCLSQKCAVAAGRGDASVRKALALLTEKCDCGYRWHAEAPPEEDEEDDQPGESGDRVA